MLSDYTQTCWGIQPLPLPNFMPWFFLSLSFVRFFLWAIHNFTIRIHGIFLCISISKNRTKYMPTWYDTMENVARPWSVFNFNVNIYLTCQTCEINPLKIVAQNTQTHSHILPFGNREKKATRTQRQSIIGIIGRQKVSFDIFLCLFSISSNKYYAFDDMEKLQLRPILWVKMKKKAKVARKKEKIHGATTKKPTATTAW